MSEEGFVKSPESPPSYTGASASRPQGAPPSYNDVMGISQLRKDIGAAKEESNNPAMMVFKICCVCTGSLICTGLVILLFGALPISLLVVGAVHKDDCHLDDRIPKWMIVYGSVSLGFSVINIFKTCICPNKKRKKEGEQQSSDDKSQSPANSCANSIEGLLNLFLFIWLIVGSVWVLGKYDEWDDADRPSCDGLLPNNPLRESCCHNGTFLFAFIFIIAMWSLGFLIICCMCTCVCTILACASTASTNS